jgi:hypothetical protein
MDGSFFAIRFCLIVDLMLSAAAKLWDLSLAHLDFIDVTPLPIFARLNRLYDRMFRVVKMLGGMLILRGIAAADVPAEQAQP